MPTACKMLSVFSECLAFWGQAAHEKLPYTELPNWLINSWKHHPLVFFPVTVLTVLGIFKALRETVANWLLGEGAGALLSNIFALISYRKALASRHGKAYLPFRPEMPIDVAKLYVPLAAAAGFSAEVEGPGFDAEAALAQFRRVMILAPPGGGKSMLLQHIATQYSAIGMRRLKHLHVPILFELHRLNGNSRPLIEHLADRLKGADVRPGFWDARKFMEKGLEDGRLLILLDGLDEVDSSQRQRALSEIGEILRKRCNVVVTCRSAVYKRELNSEVDCVVRIREFDDDQVGIFLERWEVDKSLNALACIIREA
jgi:predicted NACHT family NTPase